MKKSQSAFEFVIILCFVLFFFLLFYTAIQANMTDKIKEQNRIALKNLAIGVKNEIDLAHSSNNGYTRVFILPQKLGNQDYSISIVADMIFIKTNTDSLALPITNVNGSIFIGNNTIKKENNEVYLNF